MKRILVVEDELHLAEGLRFNLNQKGYAVATASNGLEGLRKWEEFSPDLIVLDLMMREMDGFTFLKKLRAINDRVPILVLSARFEAKDKVRCFSYGADDYMVKPFDLQEFLLRVERHLKRSDWSKSVKSKSEASENESDDSDASPVTMPPEEDDLGVVHFGPNRIDFEKNEAFNGKESLKLTLQERKLLATFVQNCDKALSRKDLLQWCWGYQGDVSTRTVDNFIVRFRKYFEPNPKKPKFFVSLRSIGYIFRLQASGKK